MNFHVILATLALAGSALAANGRFQAPPYIWVATFTPGAAGYQNGWKEWGSSFEASANAFATNMPAALRAKFPSMSVQADQYTGAELAATSFRPQNASSASQYEMLYIGTHGNAARLGGWAQNSTTDTWANSMFLYHEIWNADMASRSLQFGGWNRWVFLNACYAMNNMPEIRWATSLKGAHAVFGSLSLVFVFDNYQRNFVCGWSGCGMVTRNALSHDAYTWEALPTDWTGGKPMWDAFRDRLVNVQYTMGGYPAWPAAAGVYGLVYGQNSLPSLFDGTMETADKIYDGAVWLTAADKAAYPSSQGEVVQPVAGIPYSVKKVDYKVGNPDMSRLDIVL